ncbi:MAG: hypothetical protein HY868_15310 [Chloroflexi bacterium]|nr:hypothetical protein [Chloroflexota bacterium]
MAWDAARREQVVDDLVKRIGEADMVAPALLFLTIHQPWAFVGAQLVWFAQPLLRLGLNDAEVRHLAQLLEDRTGVQMLIDRLETLSSTSR